MTPLIGQTLNLSVHFECRQHGFPRNLFSSSGFSQEDLPSNLIGFYMAALGDKYNTRAKMEKLLGERLPNDEARTLIIQLGRDLGSQNNKHFAFTPKDHNNLIPRFNGKPLKWPEELLQYTPAPQGVNWLQADALPPVK